MSSDKSRQRARQSISRWVAVVPQPHRRIEPSRGIKRGVDVVGSNRSAERAKRACGAGGAGERLSSSRSRHDAAEPLRARKGPGLARPPYRTAGSPAAGPRPSARPPGPLQRMERPPLERFARLGRAAIARPEQAIRRPAAVAQREPYLSSWARRAPGSMVLRRPKSVLLTASLAPIIGLRTAMGMARTTARTGPCRRAPGSVAGSTASASG